MCFYVEVCPKILRTKSKAVLKGNNYIPQDIFVFGGLTMEEIDRVFAEELDKYFDRKRGHIDQRFENMEKENKNNQRLAGLQHQAQQPRLATEADVKPDTKTFERTEGAERDEEKFEDILSALVDDDPPSCTSLGNIAEPLAPEKSIGDALVNEGAEAPKPYFSPVKVRMLTFTACGLQHASSAPATLRTIFPPQPLPWSFCEETEERNNSDTTSRRKNSNHLAPSC